MAKIGWLCLNKGKWGKKQIVSSDWIETSTRGHIESKPAPRYGYHWWVKNDGDYAAVGVHGQYILVAGEMNLVLVYTGGLSLRKMFVPLELTRKYIVPSLVSSEPLQENKKENARLDRLVESVSTSYAENLRKIGSNVRVVGNREKVLKCGTRAYRTDIRWVYQDIYQLNSVLMSSYKGDQCVYVAVHPVANHEKFARIVESLKFE